MLAVDVAADVAVVVVVQVGSGVNYDDKNEVGRVLLAWLGQIFYRDKTRGPSIFNALPGRRGFSPRQEKILLQPGEKYPPPPGETRKSFIAPFFCPAD